MKNNTIAVIATICISLFTFTTTFAAGTDDFVTKWTTTGAGESITIPTRSGYSYSYNVDCDNDGTNELTAQDGDAVCTYPTAGDYTVRISGTFPAIYFVLDGTSAAKIKDIVQWGTGQWGTFANAFFGASNMEVNATDNPNLTATGISMAGMFLNASVANPNTTDWDTSKVTSMSDMFHGASAAVPDTTKWNTSNVTNMFQMFRDASLATPNTTTWNTSNVTNMGGMFNGASAATPNTTSWDTSKVTNMANMFRNASVANPITTDWNTSKVADMSGMFRLAPLANPTTTSWNTSQVTDMSNMFHGASAATPTTTGWNTSNVTTMAGMFQGASAAAPITTGWNTSKVTDMSFMFFSASAATPDTSAWDTSKVTNMSSMFSGASLAVPKTSAWDTSKVTNMSFMFQDTPLANPNTAGWNTSEVTSLRSMFQGASAANPDVSNWDVRKVTKMTQMFSSASVATPDVSGWQTDSLTGSLDGLFFAAPLANPDVSGWDVSRVTRGGSAFKISALSTANYDKLLRSWSRQTLQSDVSLGADGKKYCNTAARTILTEAPNNWTITDAGVETNSSLCTPHLTMDIDGNGSVQASTDGILIARYIASVRGASLIAGAVAGNASDDRNEADEIVAYLDSLNLDIDGNGGDPGASTDGILIARFIASVRDSALVDGAVAGNAKRTLPGITITLNNLDI